MPCKGQGRDRGSASIGQGVPVTASKPLTLKGEAWKGGRPDPREAPALPAPWARTSGFQNVEVNFSCLSCQVYSTVFPQPQEQMQGGGLTPILPRG